MNYPKVLIVGPQAKDPQYSSGEPRRLLVDIVVIDKSGDDSLHPLVYQLKQEATEILDTDHSQVDQLLRGDDDPFLTMGEVVSIDKQKKEITLSTEDIVAYKHLIVMSGSSRSDQHSDEFSNALQALIEALKIRKHLPENITPTLRSPYEVQSSKHQIAPEIPDENSSIDVEQIARKKVGRKASADNASSLSSGSNKRMFEVQL